MKLRITNNRKGPYGVETVNGGGYRFIQPGQTRTVDAANPRQVEGEEGLDVETIADVAAPPESLKSKAGAVGKADAFSGFLDRSIPLIAADLPKQTDEGLTQLRSAEEAGKSRKGVLEAIDAEIEARSE